MSLFSPNEDSRSKTLGAVGAKTLGVAIASYPMLVLKARRQVFSAQHSYRNMCRVIIRYEGFGGFYKGFGICLLGYISAQAIHTAVSEITKRKFSNSNTNSVERDLPKKTINATGVIASLIGIHLVRVPCEIVSQRLMVQGNVGVKSIFAHINNNNSEYYKNGFDVFRKIMRCDGPRGLYRGFGISILTKLISAAIWIPSFKYVAKKLNGGRGKDEGNSNTTNRVHICLSGFVASSLTTVVTMPFDTITTRMQVLDAVEENGRRKPLTFRRTVRNLVNEGGVIACYRGFGPKWASMFMYFGVISYNSLSKRMSTKTQDKLN